MPEEIEIDILRRYLRMHARTWLRRANISAVGIGRKSIGGSSRSPTLALCFGVREKLSEVSLRKRTIKPIPAVIRFEGKEIPTDVIRREHRLRNSASPDLESRRTASFDPLLPGISLSHQFRGSGTLGAFVRDLKSSAIGLISAAHVLRGARGEIIVQPGNSDQGRADRDACAKVVRDLSDKGVDAAFAELIPSRLGFDACIAGLGVAPNRSVEPEMDMRVVKSGRTTGVTYGKVVLRDVHSTHRIVPTDLKRTVVAFEVVWDNAVTGQDARQISDEGDSGALFMRVDPLTGRATSDAVGLLFAGDSVSDVRDYALAFPIAEVLRLLEVDWVQPKEGA